MSSAPGEPWVDTRAALVIALGTLIVAVAVAIAARWAAAQGAPESPLKATTCSSCEAAPAAAAPAAAAPAPAVPAAIITIIIRRRTIILLMIVILFNNNKHNVY